MELVRFLAFVGIFVYHAGFDRGFTNWGRWGVSVFLVLSGFLMTYSYYGKDRIRAFGFRDNLRFAWQKMKPLYPLHIVCSLAWVPFYFIGDETEPLIPIVIKAVLNGLLLQEWVPMAGRSMNGVSWYLSVAVFCYFMFPFVLKFLEKKQPNGAQAMGYLGILYLIQFGIGLLAKQTAGIVLSQSPLYDNNLAGWFAYNFPLTRFVDFAIGCCLCIVFIHRQHSWDRPTTTAAEISALVLSAAVIALEAWFNAGREATVNEASQWLFFAIDKTPCAIALVYSFAMGNGWIANGMDCRVTRYLAKMGRYGFLIHYVVFGYIGAVLRLVLGSEELANVYAPTCRLTAGLLLTILGVEIWTFIQKKWISPTPSV